MRLPLLVLAVMAAGISACSNDSVRDVSAPIRALGDNTNTDVRLTITYTGPTFAFYGSRPTFTANATLNGAPVPNVQISFQMYSLFDARIKPALCTQLTDPNGVAICQFYPLLFDPTLNVALDVLVSGGHDFDGNQYAGGLLRQPFSLFAAPTVTTYTSAVSFMSANDTTITLSSRTTWDGCDAGLTCATFPVNPGTVVQLEVHDAVDILASCQTVTDADGRAQCPVTVSLSAGPIILAAHYAPFNVPNIFQASSVAVPGVVIQSPPPLPVTKQDCMTGGWVKYGVFKNQGDCVSFVATHGKNDPARTGADPQ